MVKESLTGYSINYILCNLLNHYPGNKLWHLPLYAWLLFPLNNQFYFIFLFHFVRAIPPSTKLTVRDGNQLSESASASSEIYNWKVLKEGNIDARGIFIRSHSLKSCSLCWFDRKCGGVQTFLHVSFRHLQHEGFCLTIFWQAYMTIKIPPI